MELKVGAVEVGGAHFIMQAREDAHDLTAVMDKADWTLNDLSKQSIKGLYGNVINLSATRTDTYSSCRYHYFLKYGLALREPPRNGPSCSP